MKILIACEESQIVTKAFREKGHEAYSCDIQDCSGGHPEWHIKGLPRSSQMVQPYWFGDMVQKRTYLWLNGLPCLTVPIPIPPKPESTKVPGNWFNKGGKERQKNRSKFWPGIAKAMAEQWG